MTGPGERRGAAVLGPGVDGGSTAAGGEPACAIIDPLQTLIFGPPPAVAAEDEPLFDEATRRNIQGNVVPGFNKPHQHFLFLRIGDPPAARRWIGERARSVTTMDTVLGFKREFTAARANRSTTPTATWLNIAFSGRGIELLTGRAVARQLPDQSFHQGLAARSTYLGDPTSTGHPGHRDRWLVGGPDNEADVLVIVAADTSDDLDDGVRDILDGAPFDVVYQQRADALPDGLHGHEHFGFRDGVSQPGVRGRLSEEAGDFLTPRHVVAAGGDLRGQLFGLPGQPLVWPGQFVLGLPRQDPQQVLCPAEPATSLPSWATNGSYVVVRRLHQDVPAFRRFTEAAAAATGLRREHLAAMLVGRWPSGAPLIRSPEKEDADLGANPLDNNHFLFDDDTLPLAPAVDPGGLAAIAVLPDEVEPLAEADVLGAVCPHFAHIRKVNPRDGATDLGKPSDSLTRMILRRGITYGPPLPEEAEPDGVDRGLMFVSYAATIEDQFELLVRRWCNSPIHPNHGGHDPVIGQRDSRGDRARFIEVPTSAGRVRVDLGDDWVVPTGGGYFFAPSITALAFQLGDPPPQATAAR